MNQSFHPRSAATNAIRSAGLAVEPLETRIAPATILALTDTNQLLRFDSATPGTIDASVGVSGIGGGETIVGMDFRPSDGRLYALTIDASNDGRIYRIVPTTGVASFVATLGAASGDSTSPYAGLNGTSFGVDFDPGLDRLRVVSDADQSLNILMPFSGTTADTFTETDLTPAASNVVGFASTQSFIGADSLGTFARRFFGIDSTSDMLVRVDHTTGAVTNVGALGVDVDDVVGFDILPKRVLSDNAAATESAFAALRSGGVTRLHQLDLNDGSSIASGVIDTGATEIRALAVVLNVFDGNASGGWTVATNWVADIAPKPGDVLSFPGVTGTNDFAADTTFGTIVIGSGGRTLGGNALQISDSLIGTHFGGSANTISVPLKFTSVAGVDPAIRAEAGMIFSSTVTINGPHALVFESLLPATIQLNGVLSEVAGAGPVKIMGPGVIFNADNTYTSDTIVTAGTLVVAGSQPGSEITHSGGFLSGTGTIGPVVSTGGTLRLLVGSPTVQGDLTLSAATTTEVTIPSSPGDFDSLVVSGDVALNGSPLTILSGAAPFADTITLITNNGANPVGGTFAGLDEGDTVMFGSLTYAISYVGGSGNDVVLTRQASGGPPIDITGGKTATWTDVDGDSVTLKITKGTLTDLNFVRRAEGLGLQLEQLLLTGTADFALTDVTISAKRSAMGGDGFVNVGAIKAIGLDLGTVKVAGDLAQIDSGDAASDKPGLKTLDVRSLGRFGLATQGATGASLESNIDGVVGALKVGGDMVDGVIFVTGTGSRIDKISITGSLIGTDDDGGRIVSNGDIGSVSIGRNVQGGGINSARIFADGKIGGVTVGGSVIASDDSDNASIFAGMSIGNVKIGGDVVGGESGSASIESDSSIGMVTIGGSLVGGDGDESAAIIADSSIAGVKIGRDVRGGAGEDSASILAVGLLGPVSIGGSLTGGDGFLSANIYVAGGAEPALMKSVSIGGNVRGGTGEGSAAIGQSIRFGGSANGENLGKITIGGSMIGVEEDTATIRANNIASVAIKGSLIGGLQGSGQIQVGTELKSATIGDSLIGGAGASSGVILGESGPGLLGKISIGRDLRGGAGLLSGIVGANLGGLGSLTIGGSVASGDGGFSGSILVNGPAGSVTIGGSVIGTAADPVHLEARGQDGQATPLALGKLTVKGSATYFNVLAGHALGTALNADASIGAVSIGGDWIAGNIVAGADDGADIKFGTPDDQLLALGNTANVATIASITIKGQLLGTAGGTDHFGFVAEQIGKLKIGATSYPFTTAEDEIFALGATGDFIAREDV